MTIQVTSRDDNSYEKPDDNRDDNPRGLPRRQPPKTVMTTSDGFVIWVVNCVCCNLGLASVVVIWVVILWCYLVLQTGVVVLFVIRDERLSSLFIYQKLYSLTLVLLTV
jgi:hypothetical protein